MVSCSDSLVVSDPPRLPQPAEPANTQRHAEILHGLLHRRRAWRCCLRPGCWCESSLIEELCVYGVCWSVCLCVDSRREESVCCQQWMSPLGLIHSRINNKCQCWRTFSKCKWSPFGKSASNAQLFVIPWNISIETMPRHCTDKRTHGGTMWLLKVVPLPPPPPQ